MAQYEVKIDMWWGSGHCNEERFTVSRKSEIPALIRQRVASFVRRYAYDCGNLNHPLNPSLGNVTVRKIEHDWYLNKDRFKLQEFMNLEIEQVRINIETDKQFINGQYNMQPHPKNKRRVAADRRMR